jgi:hypothetical protein
VSSSVKSEESKRYSQSIEKSADAVSRILLTHIYIENLLERYISSKLVKTDRLFGKEGLSFIQKINLSMSFDEIDNQIYDSIKKINSLRNDVAHKFGFDIEDSAIDTLGRTIGKSFSEIKKDELDSPEDILPRVLGHICGKMARIVSDSESKKT